MHSKSRDWFLYDRYFRRERVKHFDSLKARLGSHYETWSYKKKKHKKINAHRKFVYKAPTVERCLLVRAIIFILRIWMLSFSVTQRIVLLSLHTMIMDEEFTTDERTIEIGCIRSSIQVKKVSTFPVQCFVVVFPMFALNKYIPETYHVPLTLQGVVPIKRCHMLETCSFSRRFV